MTSVDARVALGEDRAPARSADDDVSRALP